MKLCPCGKPAHARGMCMNCYRRERYHNDPTFRANTTAASARYQRKTMALTEGMAGEILCGCFDMTPAEIVDYISWLAVEYRRASLRERLRTLIAENMERYRLAQLSAKTTQLSGVSEQVEVVA